MFRNEFKNGLIVAILALSGGPVVFAGTTTTVTQENPTNNDIRAAYLALQDELNYIQANRQSIIKTIVETWDDEPSIIANVPHWINEITHALNKASNEELRLIQNAGSYSEVLAVLRGDQDVLRGDQQLLSFSAVNDAIAPVSEEDPTADLVFSPVPPCRIFDTRYVGGAYGNTTKDYQVYGNGTTIGGQGGNSAGCYPLIDEPSAITANFTVVPPGGSQGGWLTVYPFGESLPDASFVNWYPGTVVIANAGVLGTAYFRSYDISVYHSSVAHSLADVMGYFYPVKPAAAFKSGGPVGALKTSPLSDSVRYSFGYSVRITTTTNNQKVFWTAHQPVGTTSAASNLNIWPCWKKDSDDPDVPASWKLEGGGSYGITMSGIQRNVVSSSAVVAPGVGSFDFGLCYSTDDNRWTNNNWGYVAAQTNGR